MSVPVHPICSGGEPDSNGGVAQGLRDAVACSLQPPGRVTAEAESGERGMQQSDRRRRSEDKESRNLTVMQITRDYEVTVLLFLFIYSVNEQGHKLQRWPKRPERLTHPKTGCLRNMISFIMFL